MIETLIVSKLACMAGAKGAAVAGACGKTMAASTLKKWAIVSVSTPLVLGSLLVMSQIRDENKKKSGKPPKID